MAAKTETWANTSAPKPERRFSLAQAPGAGPVISQADNLAHYLHEIRKFPMLEAEEEYALAKRWREHGDREAAHRLVTSHLRLAAKIAMGYRGYGLPISDLISEANVGIMQAVKRFEPDRGFRFATYAMWWIRAAIQQYILHSWSLVKMGTTAVQKKLFFNLRRLKHQLDVIDNGELVPEAAKTIAERLDVPESEVTEMNRRLTGTQSLNAPIGKGGETEWQDWLEDESENQEDLLGARQEAQLRRRLLYTAMAELNDRERRIITARRLTDTPRTLEDLAEDYSVSRERIRQIETAAVLKLQRGVKIAAEQRRITL